jgi:hypothetical protein
MLLRGGVVTAPLTHATLRGLERLRYGSPFTQTPQLVRACDGVEIADEATWRAVAEVACGGSPEADTIPTCPRCAVLRDAALEVQQGEPSS